VTRGSVETGDAVIERTIEAMTHGRYLVVPPASPGPAPVLVGFHGYGELAEMQLDRLSAIAGADRWLLISIQGLNRFYQRRNNAVAAGWMTRQHRELAIADNLAYVASVMEVVHRDWPTTSTLVYAGFSQGVAMAFRAAAASSRPVRAVMAAGGDVPPEITPTDLARIGTVLLCRGSRDEWYTADIFERDQRTLRDAAVTVRTIEFDGGHEWSVDVLQGAAAFLAAHRDG
jgi:predicted esterase